MTIRGFKTSPYSLRGESKRKQMRILYNAIEITKEISRPDILSYPFNYTVGSYIYIASDFPFNSIYFKLGTPNAIPANMKIEYFGNNWSEVVELRDDTHGFTQNGHIEFTPNRNAGWTMALESSQAGISKVVYQKYWTRISFDVNLTAATSLEFVGNKFSDDTDLFSEYPIFDDANFMNAFRIGKTNWEEQHVKASELIIQDLKKKSVILGAEQILDRAKFIGASVCKVAEILFSAFGNDYVEQRKNAEKEYGKRLDLSQYSVDSNNNALLEKSEIISNQGWLSR